MNDWQSRYLGRGALPRDFSGFEIESFFRYSEPERRVIDDERRTPALKLALALQIGFLRMTGRLLEALRIVPPVLWRHLGAQFGIEAPDLASLRTMYRRRRTLFEHQDLACAVLGFHSITEARRRALVRALNVELSGTSDRQRLLQFARRWLYDRKQIIFRERELRAYIAKAIRQHEATLVSEIVEAIDPDLLARWKRTITQPREDGTTVQSWLFPHPARAAILSAPCAHAFRGQDRSALPPKKIGGNRNNDWQHEAGLIDGVVRDGAAGRRQPCKINIIPEIDAGMRQRARPHAAGTQSEP